MDTNLVYPITTDSCVVVFDWYKKTNAGESTATLLDDLQKSTSVQVRMRFASYHHWH
jgi:hypothetical protein